MSTGPEAPTNEPTDAMLRRVQGLLAKASDDAATPQESETYMAKATELIAKYGIEQAMLDAAKPAGQREQVTHKRISVQAPYARQKQDMLGWLAKAMHCRSVWHNAGRGGQNAITVFGFPSDLERLELLYSSLLLQATRDMLKEPVPYYENAAAFRRSFLAGFAATVSKRVAALYRRVEDEAKAKTPGTDLVFVARTDLVNAAMKEVFPKLMAGRASRLSGGGYGDGRRSGQRADIGQPAAGGGRRQVGR